MACWRVFNQIPLSRRHSKSYAIASSTNRPLLCHSVRSEKGTYISLYQNLAAAIRNNASLDVKWEEAASVIQVIELAKQSFSEGRTVDVPAEGHV